MQVEQKQEAEHFSIDLHSRHHLHGAGLLVEQHIQILNAMETLAPRQRDR